jgi:hypothetical protein
LPELRSGWENPKAKICFIANHALFGYAIHLSFKKEWVKKILGKKQMMSGNKMLQY